MEFLDRLKFWLNLKALPFRYNSATGVGVAAVSYDPFTDYVKLRYSRCGYVTGTDWERRQSYLTIISEYEPVS